ncbi:MAG: DeoR family transcriptional regulator [Candidatus Omnitrophota bacterium]|nr:DeoR family transcriptional regulator [Candidatus Omnitrophota bacterium]
MARNVEREARKRAVLSTTINRYILEATPIASEELAEHFDLSSATIRNIFSELEAEGYLTHPYTSGGRIPTENGYRYYVDSLLLELQLMDAEKSKIIREYEKKLKRMEDVLEETSRLIEETTHYTGIVSFFEWQDRMFYKGLSRILEQPEFKNTDKMRLLIKIIEDKQYLLRLINRDFSDKARVYIGREMDSPEMEDCSLVVSDYRRKNKPQGKLAVLGPVRMEYNRIIPALEYISDVLSEALEDFD